MTKGRQMTMKRSNKAKNEAKTLPARALAHKHAGEIKGGKNCCAGAHYQTVTIAMRKAGADPN